MKQYNINSRESMEQFFTDIVAIHKCTLHPDDPFTDMVNLETDQPTFSKEEAEYLDNVMRDCFQYCDDNQLDIYEVAGTIQVKEYKKLGVLPQDFPNF
jgi:hypothetical protein